MREFIEKNVDKIWTVIATVIGAIISYIATTSAEKRKEKKSDQREKLKEILIPYCSALELAIEAMESYKAIQMSQFNTRVRAPLAYLKAEKRVYLSQRQRNALKEYDVLVSEFNRCWEVEKLSVLIKYTQWISEQVMDYPNPPIAPMFVSIGMSIGKDFFELPVLEKEAGSYKHYVSSVDFVGNDDPENYKHIDIKITDEVKQVCGAIEYGCMTIDNISDPEEQIACSVYEYICQIDDKPEIEKIIAGTTTNDNLIVLLTKAKSMHKKLLREIDKIAG